jgi:hypothetical protein
MVLVAFLSFRRPASYRHWTVGLAVVLVVAFAAFTFLLYWNDARLREVEARLDHDDPGWRLDEIEAARAKIPDAENSARVVVAAADLLPENWPPAEFVSDWAEIPANERLSADRLGQLCSELNELQEATVEARKLTDMPRGRHRTVLTRPHLYLTSLASQQKCRRVAVLLNYTSMRREAEGDFDGALADCRAAVNAGRSVGDDSFLVSLFIRNMCVTAGTMAAGRVFGAGTVFP